MPKVANKENEAGFTETPATEFDAGAPVVVTTTAKYRIAESFTVNGHDFIQGEYLTNEGVQIMGDSINRRINNKFIVVEAN